MNNNMATVVDNINKAFNEFSITLGSIPQPSRLDRIVDGGYYKARRFGYLIVSIPLSLVKGFWHGIRDAWDNFEYD